MDVRLEAAIRTALASHFPDIQELYSYQKELLASLLAGQNTLGIVPTGGGKSLVYQLAALVTDGVMLVVSPLRALMSEQVADLRARGVPAQLISGDLPFDKQREFLRSLGQSRPRLVYVSPERLGNGLFRAALAHSGLAVSAVIVDEAHCISQWGIDFRPEYGQIAPFVAHLKATGHSPSVLALTATLGLEARADIKTEFCIGREYIDAGVIRSNLDMRFREVPKETAKFDEMVSFIQSLDLRKVIVYTYSRMKCEELCEKLAEEKISSDYFHADRDLAGKDQAAKALRMGTIRVLVATTAFGMGINIPDIDGVIHYHLPMSVEEYYQHIGRGARNAEACPVCHCLLLWSKTNFERRRGQVRKNTLSASDLEEGFRYFGFPGHARKMVYVSWGDLFTNDGSQGSQNLRLLYRLLERAGVCRTLGDIHGNIDTIRLKRNTTLWGSVLSSARRIPQFRVASLKLGIPVGELFGHVYEQEMQGNVDKLPARDHYLYLQSEYDSLPQGAVDAIVAESQRIQIFQLRQLDELEQLCSCAEPRGYVAEVLGVTQIPQN